MIENYGEMLRDALRKEEIMPFIGVYDAFSASIAARYYNGLFVSGFSFAASFYGLPDIGFISWSDIVSFAQRVRGLLPQHHIIVDIDDGYCDTEVACHVVGILDGMGISGVVLEDQQRPRKCGHYDGKQIMELNAYLNKLERVLETRKTLFVIARTDAEDHNEAIERACAFSEAGADAVLVEAVKDFEFMRELRANISCPIVFNQIAGGKSPHFSLSQLKQAGVSLVNYSTPCLFAAHTAIDQSMSMLRENDGVLPDACDCVADLNQCTALLNENLNWKRPV